MELKRGKANGRPPNLKFYYENWVKLKLGNTVTYTQFWNCCKLYKKNQTIPTEPMLPQPILQDALYRTNMIQSSCANKELSTDSHNQNTQFMGVGTYIQTENHEHQYTCNHRIHMDLCTPEVLCPRCTNNQLVLEKENDANQKLEEILTRVNNSCAFYWKTPQEHKMLDMWSKVKHKWSNVESRTNNHWMEDFENLTGFTSFINDRTIRVRCQHVESYLDKDIQKAEITGARCPDSFNTPNRPWNQDQIVRNPGDSMGILVFPNGDYAGIGSVDIELESIVGISMEETESLVKNAPIARRSGPAGGHFYPSSNPQQTYPLSMGPCTHKFNLVTATGGCSTAVSLKYINPNSKSKNKNRSTTSKQPALKQKKRSSKHLKEVKSIYNYVHMTRKKKTCKRKDVKANHFIRKKLLGEMKSRLEFLLLLVQYNIDEVTTLFTSFAHAVTKCNPEEWKNVDSNLNDMECVLLEYACNTGEMRNHQPLFAHTDGNPSHPVESLMIFGKIKHIPKELWSFSNHHSIVENMNPGLLIQPFERIVWKLRCGLDVLHCHFKNTFHVADLTRGDSNWSYVHGP